MRTKISGWVAFVAIYLALAGVLNVLWGVAALDERRGFDEDDLIWANLGLWGWAALIVGAAQLVGVLMVFRQRAAGPMIAGFLAFLGLLLAFLGLGAYPLWSAVLLVVHALVLWACTVHSDEFV